MLARRTFVLSCLSLALTGGCALYTKEEPAAPVAEQATVVVMQGKFPGGYAYLYEGDEFLGVVGPGTRVEFPRPPGEHVFSVVSENLEFMTAELQAGGTYHATIRTTPGFGGNRVYFQPRNEQGDVEDAYRSTTPVVPTERGLKYGDKFRVRKDKLYDKTWTKWSAQPEDKKAHLSVPTTH